MLDELLTSLDGSSDMKQIMKYSSTVFVTVKFQ